eukprot:4615704-Ditylum_brightwellii.AAC.1
MKLGFLSELTAKTLLDNVESYYTAKKTSGNWVNAVDKQQESIFVGEGKDSEMRDCYNCEKKEAQLRVIYFHSALINTKLGPLGVATVMEEAKKEETPVESVAKEAANKERNQK